MNTSNQTLVTLTRIEEWHTEK